MTSERAGETEALRAALVDLLAILDQWMVQFDVEPDTAYDDDLTTIERVRSVLSGDAATVESAPLGPETASP